MTVTNKTNTVEEAGDGTKVAFTFDFPAQSEDDLQVYKVNTTTLTATLQTITTHYTVALNATTEGGTVTYVTAPVDAATEDTGENSFIKRVMDIDQQTAVPTEGNIPEDALNNEFDKSRMIDIQQQEELDRSLKFAITSALSDFTIPEGTSAANRATKVIAYDTAGTALTLGDGLGVYTGDWLTSTDYEIRDLIKDTSNNNIYYCNAVHTSSGSQPISSNTDVAKWDLMVDAAAASTSATAAAASETAAAASETAAAASETAAETAETNAETAETNAETAQTNAETAQTAAETAETNAETAQTAAETAETNAETAQTAAETAETNASSSASAASTSASAASTSASAASTSASAASTSASNASTSETSATSAVGAVAWKYTFDSTTSMADPGAGEVRFDNATVASVTNLAMDATSADTGSPDISDLIASIDDGSNDTHEGFITIRKSGTPATFACYSVTGAVTDNTGWLQVPVTHVASNGTISNADTLYIGFIRTGAKGDTGATGSQGPAGSGSDTPADTIFRILDQSDSSKKIAFEASGITTSTTRTVTMPDKDLTLIDEGADLKSTGEGGGAKFLREDGDGTCSWQDIDHDQLANFASNEHFTQANITATGTIASGTWNGTSISTTYTDAKLADVVDDTSPTLGGALDCNDLEVGKAKLKDYGETLTTANTSTAYTVDLANGNVFELTLTGNCVYTFSNPPATGIGGSFTLIQKQDGTGSRTVTWPASVDWSGGTAPTITSAASSVDVFTFLTTDAGTTWYGFTAGQDFS